MLKTTAMCFNGARAMICMHIESYMCTCQKYLGIHLFHRKSEIKCKAQCIAKIKTELNYIHNYLF